MLWDFAPTFGGVELPDEDEDVVPLKPTFSFSWDATTNSEWIVIETAGNLGGCEQHHTVEHRLPFTAASITELPRLLDEVEAPARPLDPEPYVECLANGACAEIWRRRMLQLRQQDVSAANQGESANSM